MRATPSIRYVAVAALICCAVLATTASLAVARPTGHRATRPVAHAAAAECLWENASARPVLYIRSYPSKNASLEPWTVSVGGHFYGGERGHFNDGVYWVYADVGGWANASYLKWIKGGTETEAWCMD